MFTRLFKSRNKFESYCKLCRKAKLTYGIRTWQSPEGKATYKVTVYYAQ